MSIVDVDRQPVPSESTAIYVHIPDYRPSTPLQLIVPPEDEDHISFLPDEVLYKVLLFLDIDSGIACTLLSPKWRHVFTEPLAQQHCERTYLSQAYVKVLNPARFQYSWKVMLKTRPRVRMNGYYCLYSSYIKKPVRDMWTELEPGTILEVKYWRYFRFLPNGQLVYALLHSPPSDACRILRDGRQKELCSGAYYVHKGEVVCHIHTSYSRITFKLEIVDAKRGKFSHLYIREHASLAYQDPNATPCHHRPSPDPFRFHRIRDW